MKIGLLFALTSCLVGLCFSKTDISRRRKRYLAFPSGSSLQLVDCFILTAYGTEGIFTIGLTLGLAWEIPTNLRQYLFQHSSDHLHARDRRQVFGKLEAFIKRKGHDGRGCILRSICEAARGNNNGEVSFIRKLLQTIFRFPVVEAEDNLHETYNKAASDNSDCARLYPCTLPFMYTEDV